MARTGESLTGGARGLAWLMVGVGVLLAVALVVATLDGNGPGSLWLWVPAVSGTLLLVLGPAAALGPRRSSTTTWLLGTLAVILFGSVALGLLVAPDVWADPGGGGRAPDSAGEARVLGALLTAPLVIGAVAWFRSDRTWRRLVREAEARERG